MTGNINLTLSQQGAYDSIMAGHNVFLSGCAGTGKSFLIGQIIKELEAAGPA